MRDYYSSRTLEELLYNAEECGIQHEVLELASKLSKDPTLDFFTSILEAYNIVKSRTYDREDSSRNKCTDSE